ncbi:hypothetical protein [Aureibacter tunicatorum]|uniref:Uncharacterized protein n=1 Tax=Aureibacter tunicatorum TaxID=866807 RepID=A0AAE3XMG7_9BACT|nr:hypothetical protein [Aureibacter tunicatorum]MDR6239298.1 hypothetical protein [Aureibacter tunicatorum]
MKSPITLKLLPKELNSGKIQLHFHWYEQSQLTVYGYYLIIGNESENEVVEYLKKEIKHFLNNDCYQHNHLYSLHRICQKQDDLLLYRTA